MHHLCQAKSFFLNELEIIIREHGFPKMIRRRQSCQKLCSIPALPPIVQTSLVCNCLGMMLPLDVLAVAFHAAVFLCVQCHNAHVHASLLEKGLRIRRYCYIFIIS